MSKKTVVFILMCIFIVFIFDFYVVVYYNHCKKIHLLFDVISFFFGNKCCLVGVLTIFTQKTMENLLKICKKRKQYNLRYTCLRNMFLILCHILWSNYSNDLIEWSDFLLYTSLRGDERGIRVADNVLPLRVLWLFLEYRKSHHGTSYRDIVEE